MSVHAYVGEIRSVQWGVQRKMAGREEDEGRREGGRKGQGTGYAQPETLFYFAPLTLLEGIVPQWFRQALPQRLSCSRVVREPEVASHNVLKQPRRLQFRQPMHHLPKDQSPSKDGECNAGTCMQRACQHGFKILVDPKARNRIKDNEVILLP